jgi:adenine deaminase
LEDPEESEDILLALAFDRLGGEKGFAGLLKGYGLQRGACGTTMCWDSFDLVAVGSENASLAAVIHRLQELGGGAVFAIENEIIAEIASPLCGVISLEPMEKIAAAMREFEAKLRSYGVPWEKPLLTLDTLTTAAIPHLRITHDGYVRLKDLELLPLYV